MKSTFSPVEMFWGTGQMALAEARTHAAAARTVLDNIAEKRSQADTKE
jgi:hypothetical protein